jgi:hypothetical protein
MGRGSYEYHLIEVKYAFTLIYYVTPPFFFVVSVRR